MLCQWRQASMLGAAESPLGDREGGATAIFEKSGPPDSADPADFCNKIGPLPKWPLVDGMSAVGGEAETGLRPLDRRF
jgi:hypothetical protein